MPGEPVSDKTGKEGEVDGWVERVMLLWMNTLLMQGKAGKEGNKRK